MYINPKFTNSTGTVQVYDTEAQAFVSFKNGEIYDAIIAGAYGSVQAYVDTTAEEVLATKRGQASLTRREFYHRVDAMGMLDTILALENDPTTPRAVWIDLKTATSFDRTWPTLIEMATNLGVSELQLDELFGIS